MRSVLIFLLIFFFQGCEQKEKNTTDKEIPKPQKEKKIDSLESLKSFIEDGQKHGYFPTKILAESFTAEKKLETIDLNHRVMIKWEDNSKCPSHKNEIILALEDKNYSITCDDGDTLILLGKGNDWVHDAVGNDIIYAGEGNDTIETSYGSDIFVFEENWGHDTITFNPERVDTSKIIGYDGSYPWKYSSFIIFGKNIARENIQWKENTLHNIKTGDTIKLNSKEINILFADEKDSKILDKNYIAEQQKAKEVSLESLKAENVLIKDKLAYFAKGDEGLFIVNVEDLEHPMLLSKTILSGRAMAVAIEDTIAYVAQGDYGLEGKKGWVSILDISIPSKPKLLHELSFGTNIFSLAVHHKTLYIPETPFFKSDIVPRKLHIYDVTKPQNPSLLSKTTLHYFSKFIVYKDNTLYLSSFQHGVTIFDVSNPKIPYQTALHKQMQKTDWSIKASQDNIIVNHGDNVFSVLKPSEDKKVTSVCDLYTTEQNQVSGLADIDAIAIRDNFVFKAEGAMGFSISDSKKCEVIKHFPCSNCWISSLYLVENTLVAFDAKRNRNILYPLDELFPEYKPQHTQVPETIPDIPTNPLEGLSKDQLQTLLYKAAGSNDVNQINNLTQAGANPNFNGHEAHTPVQISARLGKAEALSALLENGGHADTKSMMVAALNEQIETMKILEKHGGNIASADKEGCTTLHYIAQDGTVEMVRYLVEKGVPVNATCRKGETPLKWATYGKNTNVIRYLESVGAR